MPRPDANASQMSYLDVFRELQSNGAFKASVSGLMIDINRIEGQLVRRPHLAEQLQDRVMELMRVCNYNTGLLVPYFFPKYPKAEPMSLFDRPYAFALFHFQIGGFMILRGSRQIGKSTTIGARQKILAHMIPGFRSLYIAPHIEHVETYANRLREMERAFRYPTLDQKFRQNLHYKEFENTSIIELIRILSNANDARGKTVDELIYDEYQHFDGNLEPEVQQTQKASKMNCTIYAGTSLTVDTALEGRWQQSSQGTWWLRCGCGKEIDCGDPQHVLPIIQPEGPICPKCSRLLDTTKGGFRHADQMALDAGWIGLHVPQIIIPEFSNNRRKWSEIYEAYVQYDLAKFLQEVLGIPTEEGQNELTKDDVRRMCCLPETPAFLKQRAKDGYYKWVVSGCDWGGSDYIPAYQQKASSTVHVMLGVKDDGDMDIIHMRRYGGMGYEEIANQIAYDHGQWGGGPIASDFGVGMAYNSQLRKNTKYIIADRHMIFSYVGPNSALLAPPEREGWYNQYSLNRTESITTLYQAIKRQRKISAKNEAGETEVTFSANPRIRCYNFEVAQPLITDLLNLRRVPTESNLGVTSFKYRKAGVTTDDTLHAINFAYALARVLLGEPIVEDRGLARRLQELLRLGMGGGLGSSMPGGTTIRPFSG